MIGYQTEKVQPLRSRANERKSSHWNSDLPRRRVDPDPGLDRHNVVRNLDRPTSEDEVPPRRPDDPNGIAD